MSGMKAEKGNGRLLSYVPRARAVATPIDWYRVAQELSPVRCLTDRPSVRRRSRDFFWYSPILKPILDDKAGDLVALPKNEEELLHVARYCVEHAIPLTARGAGTGNYGQCMPLHGGIVVDLTEFTGIRWFRDGAVRAAAGTRLKTIEAEAAWHGLELRMFPSTLSLSTLGGFVAGGSTGIGAINFGTNSEPGNIAGLRMLTLEDEPRFVELRGTDLRKGIHAYGTTGLITEIELALAPATAWREVIVTCNTSRDAMYLGDAVARAHGIAKRLVTAFAWSAARYLAPLRDVISEGRAVLILMIAEPSWEACRILIEQASGHIAFERGAGEEKRGLAPLYEFTWNHSTLHAIKQDAAISYLQTLFPAPDHLSAIQHMKDTFGDEVPMHVEFVRLGGVVQGFGLQLLRFTTPERLAAIVEYHEANGCPIYDPHTYLVENGSPGTADPEQFSFKQEVDPYGLLNPGKMPGFAAPGTISGGTLPPGAPEPARA